MSRALAQRNTTLLVGIGLVLVGLLAGILLMLWFGGADGITGTTPQVVERVELGAPHRAASLTAPDSGDTGGAMPDLASLNTMFRNVASAATSSVVAVRVELDGSALGSEWFHNFDDDAQRFFEEHVPRRSVGSGVVISPQGYVVTNHHVVNEAEHIRVTLSDRREYDAEIVGVDPSTDLAVVKVDAQDLPAAVFGDSDALQVGDWVLAIGNPFRLNSTVTAGIVSALGRQVNIIDDALGIEDFIQTDAAINPGNSGGALVNLQGELIGINTAIATESGSYEGYGFAVPSNLMKRVVTDLVAFGEVRRGFLGVEISPVTQRAARQLGLDQIGGVYLGHVQPGGAADKAGLQRGDVVLAVQGQDVAAPNQLQSIVARYRPGDRVELDVWRGGERRSIDVELMGREAPAYQRWLSDMNVGSSPAEPEAAPGAPDHDMKEVEALGLGLRALNARERKAFETDNGVYVAYVQHGGVAARAGVPRDVVIEQIDGRDVRSVEEALDLLEDASGRDEPVLLRVRRRDDTAAFYEVVPGIVAR